VRFEVGAAHYHVEWANGIGVSLDVHPSGALTQNNLDTAAKQFFDRISIILANGNGGTPVNVTQDIKMLDASATDEDWNYVAPGTP
jgi:hypothetical protein